MKWQVLGEKIIRARSVSMYTLKARKWYWVAYLDFLIQSFLVDDDLVLIKEDRAQELLKNYRNWMGVNRIGT